MAEMQFLLHLGMEQIPLSTPVIPAAITPLVMADAQFGFATGRTVGYIVWRVIISLWSQLLKNCQTMDKLGGISGHRLEDRAKCQVSAL